MRRCLLLAAVGVAVAGCGGARGAGAVVRAWSDAVDDGDNDRAARLFADDAQVVQGARVVVFVRVRGGKIVLWHQLGGGAAPAPVV